MDTSVVLQMAQRGVLTLPKPLRDLYNLQAGEQFTLLDLDGVFVLFRFNANSGRSAIRLGCPGRKPGKHDGCA